MHCSQGLRSSTRPSASAVPQVPSTLQCPPTLPGVNQPLSLMSQPPSSRACAGLDMSTSFSPELSMTPRLGASTGEIFGQVSTKPLKLEECRAFFTPSSMLWV